jgi:hypothetical protein
MPQNPNQVTVALNSTNGTASLRLNSDNALVVSTNNPDAGVSIVQTLGTIATTGTFQAGMAANASRALGGAIVNHGTASLLVSLTAAGDAKTGSGIAVAAGGTLLLAQVLPDQPYLGAISLTGTKADTFTTVEISKA